MKLNVDDEYMRFMMLLCLFKVYHDEGIMDYDKVYTEDVINEGDYYWEYVMEAVQIAAPITVYGKNLYTKYGCTPDDGEVYILAYSCKEMQEYFKIARKLHRLEGNTKEKNPYEQEIMEKVNRIRGFFSYNFDFDIGHKRKGAWLEVLWGYEFDCEIPMCIWIVHTMRLFRKELPKLKEKYRAVKRMKRSKPKRGGLCYAN